MGAKHVAEWVGPLRQGAALYDPTFRRGFLEEVSLDPQTFLESGERLFRTHPLRHVSIGGAGQEAAAAALATSPLLARLSADFHGAKWPNKHPPQE